MLGGGRIYFIFILSIFLQSLHGFPFIVLWTSVIHISLFEIKCRRKSVWLTQQLGWLFQLWKCHSKVKLESIWHFAQTLCKAHSLFQINIVHMSDNSFAYEFIFLWCSSLRNSYSSNVPKSIKIGRNFANLSVQNTENFNVFKFQTLQVHLFMMYSTQILSGDDVI